MFIDNSLKCKINPNVFRNLRPIMQNPNYIPFTKTDLLMLLTGMFLIYYEKDTEHTGRAKTKETGNGNGNGLENSKKFG